MTTTRAVSAPPDFLAMLDRVAVALDAIFAGDPAPYAALWAHIDDVTLYGAWGPIERGHERVTRTFAWVASRFSDGVMEPPEYTVVAVSGGLGLTVGFERGVVRVDGGPPQPMTLRVTHGFRRLDGRWWLTHRHADYPPLDQRNL